MPYSNVPKALWPKMDRCVASVKKQGNGKNAHAICYDSIVNGGIVDAANKRKGGK